MSGVWRTRDSFGVLLLSASPQIQLVHKHEFDWYFGTNRLNGKRVTIFNRLRL